MPSRSRSRGAKRGRSRSRALSRGRVGPVGSRPGYRAGSFRARSWASRSLNTHKFTRYAAGTSVFDVTTVELSNNHIFTLASVVNSSEFAQLFDQFRIDKVVVTYRLITNPDSSNILNTAGAFPQASNWYPTVWSCVDYDDSSALNISEMKERIGVKNRVLKPNQKMTFVVRPKVLVQTYRTAVSTGYAPKSMFVDMSTNDIPHYGLKTVIDMGGQNPIDTIPFKVIQEFKYYFTCQNVR